MTAGNVLIMLAVLILPVSALVARRVPLATTAKLAALWGAIFAIGWLIAARFT